MKKYSLIFKTALANKAQLAQQMIVLVFVLFIILQYFGIVYGKQYELSKKYPYQVTGMLKEIDTEALTELVDLAGVNYYSIESSQPIMQAGETSYSLMSVSSQAMLGTSLEGSYFSSTSANTSPEIIIPYSFSRLNQIKIGDHLQLKGLDYHVIGTMNGILDHSFIVPLSVIGNMNMQSFKLTVSVDQALNKVRYQQLTQKIGEMLGISVSATDFDESMSSFFLQYKIFSFVLFAVAGVNILYIYAYIMDSRQKRIGIYRLNGATKRFTFNFFIIDLLATYTISFVLAYLLLQIAARWFIPNVFHYASFRLNLSDLIQFYGVFLLIYLILMITQVFKMNHLRIIQILRRN